MITDSNEQICFVCKKPICRIWAQGGSDGFAFARYDCPECGTFALSNRVWYPLQGDAMESEEAMDIRKLLRSPEVLTARSVTGEFPMVIRAIEQTHPFFTGQVGWNVYVRG